MLAYIMLFRASQPLSQSLAMLNARAYNTPRRDCQVLDTWPLRQLPNAQCSMLNAQCSSLALIPHLPGIVKYPMQASAYTTTRERMQAHTDRERHITHLPEHVKPCENLREPAYTTQENTCQAPVIDTCQFIPQRESHVKGCTEKMASQAIYFHARCWHVLAGYAIMRGGWGYLKVFAEFSPVPSRLASPPYKHHKKRLPWVSKKSPSKKIRLEVK